MHFAALPFSTAPPPEDQAEPGEHQAAVATPAPAAPEPPTLVGDDAAFVPPSLPWPPSLSAAAKTPAIPPMGDIASLAPPPPQKPKPDGIAGPALADPLAVIAIPMPVKEVVTVRPPSPYPDPLAVLAIEMPPPPPFKVRDQDPLPALALPPPIRMPGKATADNGPVPVADPRIPVSVGPLGTDPAHPAPAPAFIPPPFSTAPTRTDAEEPSGDMYVRDVQTYLKQLGFFEGEPNGVLDWATVEALVKFDASGTAPSSVIGNSKHLDEIWIARLKTALAAKGAQGGGASP
jgi:hypothetical protein